MKFAILALLAAAGTAFAQDTKPTTDSTFTPKKDMPLPQRPSLDVPDNAEGPQITFESPIHEFGIISDDKPAIHDFKFTNTGKAALTITSVKGSCGCTVPALTKTIYQPGETGHVHVEYSPTGRRGPQHTNITVTSNDATRPTVTLDVKSEIRPLVVVDPPGISVAQVRKGEGKVERATVTSRLPELKLIAATPTINTIDAKILPGEEKEVDGEKLWVYPVEVYVLKDAPVGSVIGNISIRTSDPARPPLVLTVSGEVVGDVLVTPARIQLAGMAPGQAASSEMTLTSRNGKAFKVSKVQEQPATGTLTLFKAIDVAEDTSTTPPSYKVTMMANAPPTAGAMSGHLIISTDIPDEPTLKVQYFAYVRANQQQPLPPGMAPVKPPSVWDANPSSLISGGK